jgi:hypothetical protein
VPEESSGVVVRHLFFTRYLIRSGSN